MSIASETYEAVETLLATLFGATHVKLSDPNQLELNDTLSLNRGYGFNWGFSVNSHRNISCKLSVRREIVISLTANNIGTNCDTGIRETAEKLLLEDQMTLIKDLESDPSLQDLLANFGFSSDNGIENVFSDRNDYIVIESVFNLEYFEDLN